jgi:hypothetical protein
MKAGHALLRLLVLAGFCVLLLRAPRVPTVRAQGGQNGYDSGCANFGLDANTPCPSQCTSSTYDNWYVNGILYNGNFAGANISATPCGNSIPGQTCVQPSTYQHPNWTCTQCCLAIGEDCGATECNGKDPCCSDVFVNASCDFNKQKCCVPDDGLCSSSFDCCNTPCVEGLCQTCIDLGDFCVPLQDPCCGPVCRNYECGGTCPPPEDCPPLFKWNGFTCQCEQLTPIIIDTDGSGFQLTDYQGGVSFDMIGGGEPAQMSWTAPGSTNAFLVLDRNGDGKINNGVELFGSSAPQPRSDAPNGFLALAVFDKPDKGGNADGVIDSRDAVYSQLRLWIDANHNGISEPGELHILQEFGIDWLSFDYKLASRVDRYGNTFRYRAKVGSYPAQGSGPSRYAWDVILLISPQKH